jgi:hypothetical protein
MESYPFRMIFLVEEFLRRDSRRLKKVHATRARGGLASLVLFGRAFIPNTAKNFKLKFENMDPRIDRQEVIEREQAVSELRTQWHSRMRLLSQLSQALWGRQDEMYVSSCNRVRDVLRKMQDLSKDLPNDFSYGEPWGECRTELCSQIKTVVKGLEETLERLVEARRKALEAGCAR